MHRTMMFRTMLMWLNAVIVRLCYRLRLVGKFELPSDGPAVVVTNHESWLDAFVITALLRQDMRFVMDHRMAKFPGMAWFFRAAGAIPIASKKDNPEIYAAAFESIDAALARGESVMIFPEGKVTRDGEMAPFRNGIDKILARRRVPVIPMALSGLWGSMWSFKKGSPGLGIPRTFRPTIQLRIGKMLPVTADLSSGALEAQVGTLLRAA